MIQDTSCSPELYLLSSNGSFLGGWGWCSENFMDVAGTLNEFSGLKERNILWATNIPGESPWCITASGATDSNLTQGLLPPLLQ